MLHFAPRLGEVLDAADKIYNGINATIDKHIAARGMAAPPASVYEPVWKPQTERTELSLEASGIASVIWCIGFTPDFGWLDVGDAAGVFNGRGHPQHRRGVSAVPGLYFLGLPWLHSWGSGRFSGVARDAQYLAEQIERMAQAAATDRASWRARCVTPP
jgi:putative flavoprotein involved in K+ transport